MRYNLLAKKLGMKSKMKSKDGGDVPLAEKNFTKKKRGRVNSSPLVPDVHL